MFFWLLTVIVLASLAGIGYRQGAIRVAFSLLGIIVGALLAAPLGKLLTPLVGVFGIKNPVAAGALGPLIVFVVISVLFKVGAFYAHQKIEVHFKYRAGDLRLALWERMNHRVGLCLALVNGTLYLVLISFVLFVFGYWTVQLSSDDKDPKLMRLVTRLAHDLQSTGFAKVARSVDPLSANWYEAADLAGTIYNNPLTEALLARYPAFLSLAERPQFQEMSSDPQFTELLMRPAPVTELLDHPKAQAVLQDPALLKTIWGTVKPDLKDIPNYLVTGRSAKYEGVRRCAVDRVQVGGGLSLGHFLQAMQRKSVLAAENVVKTRAKPQCPFVATGISLAERRGDLVREGDPHLVVVNEGIADAFESRPRLAG